MIQGPTRLWASNAVTTAASIEKHDEIIKTAILDRDGAVFG